MKKVFIAIKFYEDSRNRKLIEEISNSLEEIGYRTINLLKDIEKWGKTKISSPKELMRLAFENIEECDIFLAEVSEISFGVGIEAGYAFSKGKKIILLVKEGIEIPSTLKGISNHIIIYANNLEEKIKAILK